MKPPPFKDVNVLEIVLEILFMNPLIFFFLFFWHKLKGKKMGSIQ